MILIGVGDHRCGNLSDPLNLLFRGNVSLHGITGALSGSQWILLSGTAPGHISFGRGGHFAISLYLCDTNRQHPRRQDVQFVNGHPWDRFHVRAWEVASLPGGRSYHQVITSSVVVVAAHHEILDLLGRHRVTSHESGKWKVAFDLSHSPGNYHVRNDAEYTGNFNLVPFSNDYATEISR